MAQNKRFCTIQKGFKHFKCKHIGDEALFLAHNNVHAHLPLTHQRLKEKKFSKFDKIFRNALLLLDFEYKIVFSISHLVLKLFPINFIFNKNCFSRCSFLYKYFVMPFCMYKALNKTNPEPLEFLKYLNP